MDKAGARETRSSVTVIDALLRPDECRTLIERASRAGFLAARQALAGRHNAESFIENDALAAQLKRDLRRRGFRAEVDDLFEIYRYVDGQHISVHADTGRPIRRARTSNVTLLIYLSDGFDGGHTIFPETGEAVAPAVGRAVLFEHGVRHAAEAVRGGVKYVARVDIYLGVTVNGALRTIAPSRCSG